MPRVAYLTKYPYYFCLRFLLRGLIFIFCFSRCFLFRRFNLNAFDATSGLAPYLGLDTLRIDGDHSDGHRICLLIVFLVSYFCSTPLHHI